ncbi:MAG: ABC transporter permease, partial [Myxococcales bacterium]|nr:ABC transporter permease [Myxococcales bacterium]
ACAYLTLNVVLPRLAPGIEAQALIARSQGQLDPAALEALRATLGDSDAPLLEQYMAYLGRTLTGDLGISAANYPAPVTAVIATGLLWTLALAGTAVVISFLIGSALGMLAAWRRGGRLDRIVPPLLALLGAFPYFWLAMLLLYGLAYHGGWFPVRHAYGDTITPGWTCAFFASVIRHAILPATTIVIATLGGWMLAMRNSMVTVLREDYVALAHAKGLPAHQVMLRYAARNALLPTVASVGMALGFVVSGSLLTEIVFSYPGLGYLLVQAVRNQDFALMQGLFLTITLAVLAANLLVDLACAALDPRIRDGARRTA